MLAITDRITQTTSQIEDRITNTKRFIMEILVLFLKAFSVYPLSASTLDVEFELMILTDSVDLIAPMSEVPRADQ